jgi:uncharacterized oxidoreductase
MTLRNKTIVLTGPSSGVGLELLRLLGGHNTVIGLSRRSPPPEVLGDLERYSHIATDLASSEQVASAISQIVRQCPDGIDGLINCGAVQFTPRFVDAGFDTASIAREIAINLASPAQLIAGLLEPLSRGNDPFIMNINSGLGLVPKHESAIYCATKAGLDNLTRGLRPQLVETRIKVQQAFLPLVDTPMTTGRGSGKLTACDAAAQIVSAIESGKLDTDIGKVKLLRAINRIAPPLASRIMQGAGS